MIDPRLTKVSVKAGEVTLEWTEEAENDGVGTDKHQLVSKDTPKPQLPAALLALAVPVATLCEVEDVIVTGVLWKRDSKGGIVVVCRRHLEATFAPMTWNTPYLGLDAADDTPLTTLLRKAMLSLEAAGLDYLKGHRAQDKLEL